MDERNYQNPDSLSLYDFIEGQKDEAVGSNPENSQYFEVDGTTSYIFINGTNHGANIFAVGELLEPEEHSLSIANRVLREPTSNLENKIRQKFAAQNSIPAAFVQVDSADYSVGSDSPYRDKVIQLTGRDSESYFKLDGELDT